MKIVVRVSKQVKKVDLFMEPICPRVLTRARSNPFNFIFNAQSVVVYASEQVEKKGRSIFRGV